MKGQGEKEENKEKERKEEVKGGGMRREKRGRKLKKKIFKVWGLIELSTGKVKTSKY